MVHADKSPVNTTSIDHFKYALGFGNGFSSLAAEYLPRTKAEVATKLLKVIADLCTFYIAKEFKFRFLADICLQQRIQQELTCEYTPEQKGTKMKLGNNQCDH